MKQLNTLMALEMMGEFFQNKMVSSILKLACQTMPLHWGRFVQRIQLLAENSLAFRNSTYQNQEAILKWTSRPDILPPHNYKKSSLQRFHAKITSGDSFAFVGQSDGASHSSAWIPLDLFMEDAVGWLPVVSASAVDILTGLVKSLQAVNSSSWHDTFLALWAAALRLVQRGRETVEGFISHNDYCLLILLSVTPLAIINILEEEGLLNDEIRSSTEDPTPGLCHQGFISSLQVLGEFKSLLTPLPGLSSRVSQAAVKAMVSLSGAPGSEYVGCMSMNCMMDCCSGNLWHLILEACIARNLVGKSVHSWPGYLNGCTPQIPQNISAQLPGWSALMSGSPLTPSLINILISTPASSLEEIEKVYDIAIHGPDDEKIPATEILCGETFVHGWNIHEHTVLSMLKLLSPPVHGDYPEVSELAGALMHICEAFGSCLNFSWKLTTGEIMSAYLVFSSSLLLLLRIWFIDNPPVDRMMPHVFFMGPQFSPEYLLSILKSQHSSTETISCQTKRWKCIRDLRPMSGKPMLMESFPKLKLWYRQQLAFTTSNLSDVPHRNHVHQIVDQLLNMMFRKRSDCGEPLASATPTTGTLSGATKDASLIHELPAWDILEAVPFVLDIILTSCAEGRLSPRELTVGLKDLADFLPASLGTILTYFSAEVRRGVLKQVFMNGTDWPSPAANLSTVEQDLKNTLASIGVHISIPEAGDRASALVPLPLAALICLTITYKFDRAAERVMGVLSQAMHSLVSGCPWPCMPILSALWSQKLKQTYDMVNFSCACTFFYNNHEAVVQLLKSCFSSVLALGASLSSNSVGLGAVLGDGFGSYPFGGLLCTPNGIFYLRAHRNFRDVTFLAKEILSILLLAVRGLSTDENAEEHLIKLKATKLRARMGQVSLVSLIKQVKFVASFGASLLWLSGEANLVQTLFKETLPNWLMCGGDLAYFALYSGTFTWGVDSALPASKQRSTVLRFHLEFLADLTDRKIIPHCGWATWRAYVSGFLGLMVEYMPAWVCEVDVNVLKRLSKGLRQWNEEGLALALLLNGDVSAVSAAAELIIDIF